MRKIILDHHKAIHENKQEFYNVFGIALVSFFNPITGFDIVKFDEEFIKSADGESVKDKVLCKFGQEGVDVITNLL